jgi:hypothetical protein
MRHFVLTSRFIDLGVYLHIIYYYMYIIRTY